MNDPSSTSRRLSYRRIEGSLLTAVHRLWIAMVLSVVAAFLLLYLLAWLIVPPERLKEARKLNDVLREVISAVVRSRSGERSAEPRALVTASPAAGPGSGVVTASASPDPDARSAPATSARMPLDRYLILSLSDAYLGAAIASEDSPEVTYRRIVRDRDLALRIAEYAKHQPGVDPLIVNLWEEYAQSMADCVSAMIESRVIDAATAAQYESARQRQVNQQMTSGLAAGAAVAATGGAGLPLAGYLIDSIQGAQAAGGEQQQISEADRIARVRLAEALSRLVMDRVARGEARVLALAQSRGWNAADTGWLGLTQSLRRLENAGDPAQAATTLRQLVDERAERTPDSIIASLQAVYVYTDVLATLPTRPTAEQIAAMGLVLDKGIQHLLASFDRIPADAVFDADRAGVLLAASAMASIRGAADRMYDDWLSGGDPNAAKAANWLNRAVALDPGCLDDSPEFVSLFAMALARAGDIDSAFAVWSNMPADRIDGIEYAVLLTRKGKYADARQWLRAAMRDASADDLNLWRGHPVLDALRKSGPKSFAEVMDVQVRGGFEPGVLQNDFVLYNLSAFPITGVTLVVTVKANGRTYDETLKVERMEPGVQHRFENVFNLAGVGSNSGAQLAQFTFKTDQDWQRQR